MIDDLTKFTERFYNNREPVGRMINEIENLDTKKTRDELDTLGKEYCNAIARLLPDFRGIYVDGYSTRINGEIEDIKYNGLICRFYSGDREHWGGFIPNTTIPYDKDAHSYSREYLDSDISKTHIIKRLHKIVAILESQKNNPKIFEELKIVMHTAKEFECSGGMKEKLSAAITAMESKLHSSIDGLFYTFKDNCINTVLGGMYNGGQSTHDIAGARYMIRKQYGITQNEEGSDWDVNLSDILISLQTYFDLNSTIHDAINYVTEEVINKLNSINYDPNAATEIRDEEFRRVLGNPLFEAKNLFDIDWDQNPENLNFEAIARQHLNFEAIARQQVIQHATNRLQFIKDQEMRVLGMESVFDLIMTASGSEVKGKSYSPIEEWRKIPIKKDFSTLDEILESLKLVSSPGHKDAIVQILEKVKTEIEIPSLDLVQAYRAKQVYKIDNCIRSLNDLTAQQYAANLKSIEQLRQEQEQEQLRQEQLRQEQEQRRQVQEQLGQEQLRQVQEQRRQVQEQEQEQRRQVQEQRRQEQRRQAQLRQEQEQEQRRQAQLRQEQIEEQLRQVQLRQVQQQEQLRQVQEQRRQAQVRQVQSLTLDVIITAYNLSHYKNYFTNQLWDKYNLLVGQDKKEQFNEKADVLYDSFSKIKPTDSEDLQVTLFDDIKAFMLFIAKCVLTLGILPLVEAVEGKSYFISSDKELKTIAQEKHTSFVDFVRSNAGVAALQQQ